MPRFRAAAFLVLLQFGGVTVLWARQTDASDPWRSPPHPDTNLPVLTTVRQLRELSTAEAQRQYPVHVTAVVTFFDPFWKTLFVQDDTGGTWVYRTFEQTNLFAGNLLELTGASAAIFGPAIKPVSLRVLGRAPLPKAKDVTYESLATGKEDGRRVQTQGVIRKLGYQYGLLEMVLAVGNDRFTMYLPRFDQRPLPTNLIGARVEVPGVCSMKLNKQGQITGLWFYVSDLESIKVLRPAAVNPYEDPIQPINALLRYDTWASFGERVKIAGVVTHWISPGRLYLRDETRSVPVELMQPWQHSDPDGRYLDPPPFVDLHAGDQIEVIGYRSVVDGQFSLVDAEFRVKSHGASPAPRRVAPEVALNPDLDGELVSLDARLIESEFRPAGKSTNQVLSLLAGETLFEAELADPGNATFDASRNSLVRVTGVNAVQTDPWRRAKFFHLLLRSNADATVLQAPPLWTLQTAAKVGAAGGLVILAGVVWIILLRREVARSTAGLRHANERLKSEIVEREEVQFSLARFKAVTEATSDMVAITSLGGALIYLNSAGRKLVGLSDEVSVEQLNFGVFYPPWVLKLLKEKAIPLSIKDGSWTGEAALFHADGREVPVSLVCLVIRAPDGQPAYMAAIHRDISHQRRAQLELEKSLEHEKELNALKSNFISMVSHEIRTPLALILSSSEILDRYLDRLPPEKRRRHLDTISDAISRMTMLVEDVLMFSRSEAGPLEFNPAPLDLAIFCRQLVDEVLSATARRCPIRLVVPDENNSPGLDEMLLHHILVNLLTNAVKFSNAGAEVLLEARVESHQVVFAVQDRGIGIPEADRKQIFEPFYRGRNAIHIPGTGLGLAIVRKCIERHGGTLEIDSRVGAGTRFTVRVPAYGPSDTDLIAKNTATTQAANTL